MKTDLKKLEERLNKLTYKIKFVDGFNPKNIDECISECLDLRKTAKVGKGTYESYQHIGFSRSLHDMYLICKYYFPKCTMKQVFNALLKYADGNNGMCTMYCSEFGKRMFSRGGYSISDDIKKLYIYD